MKTILLIASFLFGALFSDWLQMLLDAQDQFVAILFVVLLDSFFGIAKAFKMGNFETKKTFKAVFMLVAFWLLLATVLTIEKGFPFASFLSEAILFPILLFQLISTVKNMNILGLIDNPTVNKILQNIDKHKEI
jgi:phage-related holin